MRSEKAERGDTCSQSDRDRQLGHAFPPTHVAGWTESSNAWMNMTDCALQSGGHRVYWNSVIAVAEWPSTVAQKERPGNTADYSTLHRCTHSYIQLQHLLNSLIEFCFTFIPSEPASETTFSCGNEKSKLSRCRLFWPFCGTDLVSTRHLSCGSGLFDFHMQQLTPA